MKRGYASLSHGQIHFREVGERGQPSILWIHQSPSSSEMYEALMAAMPGYYHLAPDTPGFGQSDPLPDFSISKFGDILADFLSHMTIQKSNIFGHHTGASIAVSLTSNNPERVKKLALSGPPMLNDNFKKRILGLAVNEPLGEDGSHLTNLWNKISVKEQAVPLSVLQRELSLSFKSMGINQQTYQAVADYDFESDVRKIAQSTLVFAGDQDPLLPCLEPAYEALQNGIKMVIPGGASYICETKTLQVAKLLTEFFEVT